VSRPWISIVIPAYNEERGITSALSSVSSWLADRSGSYEIIVVDNASEDRTVECVQALADGERIRVLRNASNYGKGYSVRRGMLDASAPLRLHCDADCVPCFSSLPLMLRLAEQNDVVVGSRLAAGARISRRQPLRRRIVGRTFVDLCRLLLHEPTRDLFCGFKLWREEAALATYSRTQLDGWTFDAEALAVARALGYRLRETGIAWDERQGSRLSMPRVLVPVLRELLQARRDVRRLRSYDQCARDVLMPEPAEPRP